jgi:hypothetical protein
MTVMDHEDPALPEERQPGRPCGAICAGKVRDGVECSEGRCAVRESAARAQPAAPSDELRAASRALARLTPAQRGRVAALKQLDFYAEQPTAQPAAQQDDAWDRNAERLTAEAGLGGGRINQNATSIDDLFTDDAQPAAQPLLEALREARRWIGDGDLSDGMHSDTWTPRYAAAIAMIDAALAEYKGAQPAAQQGRDDA